MSATIPPLTPSISPGKRIWLRLQEKSPRLLEPGDFLRAVRHQPDGGADIKRQAAGGKL